MKFARAISSITLAVYPYLAAFAAMAAYRSAEVPDKTLAVVIIILGAVFLSFGVAACVICNISSIRGVDDSVSAACHFMVKSAQLPAHAFLWLVTLGSTILEMFEPLLLAVSWMPMVIGIPLMISIIIRGISGAANITACLNLRRHRRCSTLTALILGICSFIIIADIVSAIVQILISVKKVKEQTNGNRQK